MKCLIIYFSQTGNTEKIAQKIQAGIKQKAGNCEIAKIRDVNPRRLHEYDLIGFGCPVIGFVEPLNVQAFIRNMRFVGGKHAFVFATHATRGEFFFPSIVPKLRHRGMIVVGMYDCYAGMGPQSPTGGHPDEIDFKEAEAFGWEVVECSQRISAGETKLIPSYPSYVEFNVNKYIRDRQAKEKEMGVPEMMAERRVAIAYDPTKCTFPECRLCMINCPMEGIDVSIKPPVIGKPCMRCLTCVRNCPTGAIMIARPETPQPEIPEEVAKAVHEEFYLKPLAKAEAEGRFRRLVPVDASWGFGRRPAQGEEKPSQ